jgi:hypothetical protein
MSLNKAVLFFALLFVSFAVNAFPVKSIEWLQQTQINHVSWHRDQIIQAYYPYKHSPKKNSSLIKDVKKWALSVVKWVSHKKDSLLRKREIHSHLGDFSSIKGHRHPMEVHFLV